ncbi:MAG TPA: hypothetical protein VFH73_22680 [Polyangia bacterium]|nr:hypothetical protein [Polyangia bacterium]
MVTWTTLSIAPNLGRALGLLVTATMVPALAPGPAQARASSGACEPAVSVRGDSEEALRISRALNRFQITDHTAPGCGMWLVTASRAGSQLALQIDDGHGLTLVRRVSSADVAAAVIDSWVRRDLATVPSRAAESRPAPIAATHGATSARVRQEHTYVTHLGAPSPSKASKRRLAAAAAQETASSDASATVPPTPVAATEAVATVPVRPAADKEQPDHLNPDAEAAGGASVIARTAAPPGAAALARGPASFALGTEASFARDGSRWWGGRVTGCLTAGRFCVGLLARADTNAVAPLDEAGTVNRLSTDLFATVSLPIALGGGIKLLPEAGVGGGRLRSAVKSRTPTAGEPGAADGPADNINWGLRATTRATLMIPLWWKLAIDVTGSLDTSFANRDTKNDADGSAPGEPHLFLRGGVALRYGAP